MPLIDIFATSIFADILSIAADADAATLLILSAIHTMISLRH
jgi:hypothetical protein